MSRTVFILGAGASVDSGAPTMAGFIDKADALRRGPPGLAKEDQQSFDLVFRGINALRAAHSKATLDIDNIESVFGAFEMARLAGRLAPLNGDEVAALNPAMRRLIVTTLGRSIRLPVRGRQVDPAVPYSDFGSLVARIQRSNLGPVSFITFNYDLNLDYMLHFKLGGADYCFDDAPGPGVPLMKLHGSVNWFRCKCGTIAPWGLQAFLKSFNWDRALLTDKVEWVDGLDLAPHVKHFEHCAGQPCEPDPIIVPPTWNKSEYHQVANVWKHAAHHLSDAENIIVIGYSLPESDQFFRFLFALGTIGDGRPQRFWIIDPDPGGAVETRFRALLGQAFESRFTPYKHPFVDGVRVLNSVLRL
jgi:NAD-dependent SIR2 family protein deacetylase